MRYVDRSSQFSEAERHYTQQRALTYEILLILHIIVCTFVIISEAKLILAIVML